MIEIGNIIKAVINELLFLQNDGIKVEIQNLKSEIFFQFVLAVGDNLGLHEMHGLVESFSANYFCRFCTMDKASLQGIFSEDQVTLRTQESYENDLKTCSHGVKKNSPFPRIPGYHFTKNIYADFTHDYPLGVCKYDVGMLLNYFISEKNLFSLEVFNERLNGLNYGKHEKRSKPPELTENNLTSKYLSSTASETLCFLRVLPLVIGDLVPEDSYWKVLINLRHLVEISFSPVIHTDTYVYLGMIVAEYLKLLNEVFPNSLKPKHHFLIHHARVMKEMGPLPQISTIRFESKHQEGKKTATVSRSRKNISKTLSVKHQLILNYRLIKEEEEGRMGNDCFVCGPMVDLDCSEEIFDCIFENTASGSNRIMSSTNWIDVMGLEIEIGGILMKNAIHGPKFFEVKNIFSSKEFGFFIFSKKLKTIYDEHYDSYEIIRYKKNMK